MSNNWREINVESKSRKDIYPNNEDLKSYEKPNLEDRVTLNKIFGEPEKYNLSTINTEPIFKYPPDQDEFIYHSNQFDASTYPLQVQLNAEDAFYDMNEYIEDTQNDPSEIDLKVLDIERDILDDFTVVLIGRRRSGKSWMARWIMYHLRNRFPCGAVITGTKHNSFWSTMIPDDCVFELKDMNIVIDDCRFSNEFSALQKYNTKFIHVQRGELPEWYDTAKRELDYIRDFGYETGFESNMYMYYPNVHISEWGWINENFDNILKNDGTKIDFECKIDKIIKNII